MNNKAKGWLFLAGAIAAEVQAAVGNGTLSTAQAARYVGTHPMAGSERSGPVAARGRLFTAAPWVVCATEATDPAAVARRMVGTDRAAGSVRSLDREYVPVVGDAAVAAGDLGCSGRDRDREQCER